MSLQVWLPLNGDLINYGLSGASAYLSGLTENVNGKIGKCYTSSGAGYINSGYGNGKIIDNLSICCCFTFTTVENNKIVFGSPNGSNQCCYLGYTNNNWCIAYGGTSWSTGNGASLGATANVWQHLALTINNKVMSLYINGEKMGQTITLSTAPTAAGNIFAFDYGEGTSYRPKGMMNDFRIYDHALSPKEVKEISKALVLHYKLDNLMGDSAYQGTQEIDCGITNVYDGTIAAAATYTSNTPRYSTAIQSNGAATLVTSTQNFSFLDNSPFSISIWAYSDNWETSTAGKERHIVSKCSSTAGGFQIYSAANAHRFRIYWIDNAGTTKSTYFQTADTFTGEGWHHFVATFDGSTMSTYLDGKYYEKTSSTSFKNTSSAPNFKVGNGSNTFMGAFSDCRIYATALSAEDVLELYHTAALIDNGNNVMAYEFKEV